MPLPLIPIFAGKAVIAGGIALYGHRLARRLQTPAHYAANTPVFDPATMLQGAWRFDGLAHGFKGRVDLRVSGSLHAHWEGAQGRLDTALRDEHGNRWHQPILVDLAPSEDAKASITWSADTVEGTGELSGNSLRLRYKLRLPKAMGGWHVDAEDWIFAMPDGGFSYQGQYHKLGFPVGTFSGLLHPLR